MPGSPSGRLDLLHHGLRPDRLGLLPLRFQRILSVLSDLSVRRYPCLQ